MNFVFSTLALALAVAAPQASAQIMLPGAAQAGPEGAAAPPAPPAAKAKPAPPRPPGEEAIADRDLARNGTDGQIRFRRAAGGLEITALSLVGEQISQRGEACQIDVVAGAPIAANPAGRPRGLLRFEAAIEACPFSFEALDGAVLIAREPKSCDFVAADCRVDPSGLWGPAAAALDDKQIQQLEHARGGAEAAMRSGFHALLARAGADKAAVKTIASEQAAFSSEREVACRLYAKEDSAAYCALRLTQARVFALQAQLGAGGEPKKARAARADGTKAEAKKETKPQP